MKKAVIALALLLLLGPFMGLLGIGVLMNPSANAECTIDGSGITVGNIPDSLTVTTQDGTTFTLNRQQLTHAATIITIGRSFISRLPGTTRGTSGANSCAGAKYMVISTRM